MLILMAGPPGTGKSKLAEALGPRLNALILNRDHIRDMVFPEPYLDYSEEQNEIVSRFIYDVASYILRRDRNVILILDGRPHSKRTQVEFVRSLAEKSGHQLRILLCTAPDDVVRKRLENDARHNPKLGKVRTFEHYLKIKHHFDPIPFPHLLLDTSQPLPELLQKVMDYLKE